LNLFKHNFTRLFGRLSTTQPYGADKTVKKRTAAITYILNYMCTAAYIFIEAACGRMTAGWLCTPGLNTTAQSRD